MRIIHIFVSLPNEWNNLMSEVRNLWSRKVVIECQWKVKVQYYNFSPRVFLIYMATPHVGFIQSWSLVLQGIVPAFFEFNEKVLQTFTVTTKARARLSTPEKAAISRKRKMQTNPNEKKQNVRGTTDPKVSAWDRLNQFKGEHLAVVTGKSRCGACKETVCKKKSSVTKHIELEFCICWRKFSNIRTLYF